MDYRKAIEVIKNNYPPENYTQLREALDMAIKLFEKESIVDKNGRIKSLGTRSV